MPIKQRLCFAFSTKFLRFFIDYKPLRLTCMAGTFHPPAGEESCAVWIAWGLAQCRNWRERDWFPGSIFRFSLAAWSKMGWLPPTRIQHIANRPWCA